MNIRELRYFLAVAEEGNISKAAEYLYITQPSLSRQLQGLESEIGSPLFVRGGRKVILTETGVLLRKRAQELLALYEKTKAEIMHLAETLGGDIHIGGGESRSVEFVAKAEKRLQAENPRVKFHFFSGDTCEVMEKLDKGLIDFGILVEPADLTKYEYVRLPQKDVWGVLMRKDSPLAQNEFVTPEDLYDLPLIRSKHTMSKNGLSEWFRRDAESLNVVATYNLLYNASLLVKEGLGYAVGLDGIIDTSGDGALCFRPLKPRLETTLALAWKKHQVFSPASKKFLESSKRS